MLTILISFVAFLLLIITGCLVIIKNPKKEVNLSLGISLICIGLWLIGVAGLSTSLGENVLFGRLIFVAAIVGLEGLYLFAYFLVTPLHDITRYFLKPKVSAIFASLLAIIMLTPLMISSVKVIGGGKLPEPSYGALYGLFIVWALLTGVSTGILLVRNYTWSRGVQKAQAQIILLGITLAVASALTTNIALPQVFGTAETAKLAPLAAVILALTLGYAVLRHRFLDIRLVLARSLGYVATITTLSSLYGFIVFGACRFIFDLQIPMSAQVFFSFATGIATLSFHYFKRLFDRLTNKLFYQDAYDPEVLFDEYNKVLVSTIDLDLLMNKSAQVVTKFLKTDHCLIVIKDGTSGYKHNSNAVVDVALSDIVTIRNSISRLRDVVTVVYDIPSEQHIREVLNSYDADLLVRLVSGTHRSQENLGFMLLGPKKSGNPYNTQDAKVIEALANELAIASQNALRFEEIERFNETLQKKVRDATTQLRQSNKKLKQLNESKDDFIGMTSHQLRTPLTSIKGYISIVMDGDAGRVNSTQRRLLGQSFNSAQKMVYLIADLLNVSRLKTGKFTIERKPTNLAPLVQDEVAQLAEEAAGRDLELTYDQPKSFPVLPLDDTKTRQVVMNFIDNAIYYTPRGGHIRVEVKELPKSVEFRVIDDGIGVPKEERHHLFTKFYRAKNALRARPDGTGLGLYMSRKVIAAQGGAIIFDSVEGKGSTFGFTFPKDMTEATPATDVSAAELSSQLEG